MLLANNILTAISSYTCVVNLLQISGAELKTKSPLWISANEPIALYVLVSDTPLKFPDYVSLLHGLFSYINLQYHLSFVKHCHSYDLGSLFPGWQP